MLSYLNKILFLSRTAVLHDFFYRHAPVVVRGIAGCIPLLVMLLLLVVVLSATDSGLLRGQEVHLAVAALNNIRTMPYIYTFVLKWFKN